MTMTKHVCNVCGRDFDHLDERQGANFTHLVGYGSKYDGATVELDVCCECLDNILDMLVSGCKINPIRE